MIRTEVGNSHWLTPWEQEEVIRTLLESDGDVLKFDNNRGLPLKMGGSTDVYINLRNARNDPRIVALLARLYANPLQRLGVKRFGEVPEAVSCFAGPLSVQTGLPFTTLREKPKDGRVSDANIVGRLVRNEPFALIDDVVTDGGSKIVPVRTCLKAGVDLAPLVVLVDRQQGWKAQFLTAGLDLDVWAGMTLHNVRKFLISRGIMQRCTPEAEAANPIIVAYDGKSWDECLPVLDQLRTTGCIIKVNDLLFWEGYRDLMTDLSVYGRVMIDLKGHDIPNTITNILKRFATNPPWAVTIHASGGAQMIRQAVEAFRGTSTKVVAVTVLTSMDKARCQQVYHHTPANQVKRLVALAYDAGARAFVCSPEEASWLRKTYPDSEIITPGIRSEGVGAGDQKRIATPAGALEAGSNYLVMGRQLFDAVDGPVAEVQRLLEEEIKRP